MAIRSKGSIEAAFDSDSAAKSAEAALAGEKSFERARTMVARRGNSVSITVDADDVVALRAALNGMLRNLQVFECIEKNISEVE